MGGANARRRTLDEQLLRRLHRLHLAGRRLQRPLRPPRPESPRPLRIRSAGHVMGRPAAGGVFQWHREAHGAADDRSALILIIRRRINAAPLWSMPLKLTFMVLLKHPAGWLLAGQMLTILLYPFMEGAEAT